LKPLADFTNDLKNTLATLQTLFDHPRDLFSEISKQINELQKPQDYPVNQVDFFDFADSLMGKLSELSNLEAE
jgi:hypothetical protein